MLLENLLLWKCSLLRPHVCTHAWFTTATHWPGMCTTSYLGLRARSFSIHCHVHRELLSYGLWKRWLWRGRGKGEEAAAAEAAMLAKRPEWQTALGWFPWSQKSAAASSHLMTNIWGTFSQIEEIRVSSPPRQRKGEGVWVGALGRA